MSPPNVMPPHSAAPIFAAPHFALAHISPPPYSAPPSFGAPPHSAPPLIPAKAGTHPLRRPSRKTPTKTPTYAETSPALRPTCSQTYSRTFFEDSYLSTANRLLTRLMNLPYSPLSDYAFRQVWGFSAYGTLLTRGKPRLAWCSGMKRRTTEGAGPSGVQYNS